MTGFILPCFLDWPSKICYREEAFCLRIVKRKKKLLGISFHLSVSGKYFIVTKKRGDAKPRKVKEMSARLLLYTYQDYKKNILLA